MSEICPTCKRPKPKPRMSQRHDERQDYETPPELFEELDREFGPFDLDVCATKINAKTDRYYSPEDDAFAHEWEGKCWMNPPYGLDINKWVEKASRSKALVVCLLPARTDTKWWHEHVVSNAKEIRFLKGRISFWIDGEPTGERGKFSSAVVVFDGR